MTVGAIQILTFDQAIQVYVPIAEGDKHQVLICSCLCF